MIRSRDDPQVLYHYTSLHGLLGIIESQALWASDTRYLSDHSEFSYPREVLARVVEKAREYSTSGNARWLLDVATLVAQADNGLPDGGLPLYAACVCANGDLPSQWNDYADQGTGFAVGMDRGVLYEAARRQGYSLGPVIYAEHDQETHLEKSLMEAIQLVPECQATTDSPLELTVLFATSIVETLTLIKSHRFSEEAEWRLMRQQLPEGAADVPPRRRTRGPANIPYEDMALTNAETGEIAIAEIIAGPAAPVASVERVRRRLDRHGLGHVALSRSGSPS
jgi:hypothetical protein